MAQSEISLTDEEIISLLKQKQHELAELVELVWAIKDVKLRNEYISGLKNPLRIYVIDNMLRLHGTDEEKASWLRHVIKIPDISKLSVKELEKMPDNTMIRIVRTLYRHMAKAIIFKRNIY